MAILAALGFFTLPWPSRSLALALHLSLQEVEKSGDDVRRRGDDPLSYSVRIMTLDMYQMSGLAKEHSNACVSKNYVRQTRCSEAQKAVRLKSFKHVSAIAECFAAL